MHYGQICNQGIGCTVSSGDRTMADYFALNLDKSGAIRIVYNDTTSQNHGAHLYEARQLDGKTITGKKANDRVPKSPVKDDAGDAQWPHYSPIGAGPNQPQLDLTNVALSMAEPEHPAGEDDGRRPGRDAPAAGQGERGLADALPGALGRRLRRGGLPDLLRRGRVDRRPGAAVLRRLDDLHGDDAAELQGRGLPAHDGCDRPRLREHDLGGRPAQRRLRDRPPGRQQALQRDRRSPSAGTTRTTSTRTSTSRTPSTSLSAAPRGGRPAESDERYEPGA